MPSLQIGRTQNTYPVSDMGLFPLPRWDEGSAFLVGLTRKARGEGAIGGAPSLETSPPPDLPHRRGRGRSRPRRRSATEAGTIYRGTGSAARKASTRSYGSRIEPMLSLVESGP